MSLEDDLKTIFNKTNTADVAAKDIADAILNNSAIPIAGIIPWYKNLSGAPALPSNWAECDGSTINDPESPLNGATLPNINGDGRFIRGSATAGVEQSDAFQGHIHTNANTTTRAPAAGATVGVISTFSNYSDGSTNIGGGPIVSDGSSGTPRTSNETRPINISMVYIMRIK